MRKHVFALTLVGLGFLILATPVEEILIGAGIATLPIYPRIGIVLTLIGIGILLFALLLIFLGTRAAGR